MMGVGVLASLLLVAPTATWADNAAEGENANETDSTTSDIDAPEIDDVEGDAESEDGDDPVGEPDGGEPDPAKPPTQESAPPASPTSGSEAAKDDGGGSHSDTPSSSVKPQARAAADPYLEWRVQDEQGNDIGGASFRVNGPATRGFLGGVNWGSTYTVTDCTGGDCANSLDKDPRPGVFQVPALDNHQIDNTRRYQVSPASPPSDWGFLGGTETRVIPGDSGSGGFSPTPPTPTPSPWGEVWDFETFLVSEGMYSPVCEPGYVYGISSSGSIREVQAGSSSATDFGTAASGVSSFNGIGIGPAGSTVFAYERSSSLASIELYEFNTGSGTWSSLNKTINSHDSGPSSVQFVAGGVDLNSGKYYVGGFGTTGNNRFFSIWEYDPGSGATSYKGWVNAGGTSGNVNGDLAFDQNGNMFIVRGSSSTTQVISITAANLQNASGGAISAATSNSVSNTTSNVNGVAFDASGQAFLGSSGALQSYNMPNWSNKTTIISSGLNSTDLATCSSPATITVEKVLQHGRVDDGDQFKLTLNQGSSELATETTTGTDPGVQEDRIGPLPTSRGVELSFAETAAGTTNMNEYASSYRCYVDGEQDHSASGNGTSGTITIPTNAQDVKCEFRNVPLVADIAIHKEMLDVEGGNPSPQSGWEVEAGLTAVNGSAHISPTGAQNTDSDGVAQWRAVFETKDDSATVTIGEEQRSGFEFDSAACRVTHLNGSTTDVDIDAVTGQVPGVAPGDDVQCVFTNKPASAELRVDKEWVIDGGEPIADEDVDLDGLNAQLLVNSDEEDWGVQPGPFAVGETAQISETAYLDSDELPACELGEATIKEVDGDDQPLGSGFETTLVATNHFVITNHVNCEQTLTLIKEVDNDSGGDLFPHDWSLDSSAWNGKLFAQGDEGDLTFDSGESKAVQAGVYVLSEGDVAGYVPGELTCQGSELGSDHSVEVELGQDVECTFTNVIAPGSIAWGKVGSDDGGYLAGSEWQLQGPDGIDEAISDDPNSPGEFNFEGLPWGEYTLTETTAPAGYKITEDPIEFVITGDALQWDFGNITNEQREGPDLPLTGGWGRDHIYIAGVITVLFGMSAYLYAMRRRKA